jgi:hypothetical protein
MYKLGKIHVVADALSRLLDITKPTCVHDQTTNASLFYIEPKWLNDVKEFMRHDKLRARYQYNKNINWLG